MPVLPFIYLAIILAFVILFFAFYIDDYIIKSIASIFLIIIGIFIITDGIESITNLATRTLGVVHICIGFYIWITESYEQYKDM